jgi:hypothetical protein
MMIGPMDPDSLDPAVLRDQAALFEAIAARKRERADWVELEILIAALQATDETGRSGFERLIDFDPASAWSALNALYARLAVLTIQIAAREA